MRQFFFAQLCPRLDLDSLSFTPNNLDRIAAAMGFAENRRVERLMTPTGRCSLRVGDLRKIEALGESSRGLFSLTAVMLAVL
jgi:hypothetical protein